MENQYNYNYDAFLYHQPDEVNSNFTERNVPFANMNFQANMNSNNMNSNIMMPNANNQNLAQPYEGYIQGNLFNNLYVPYKNYRPMRLIPNNEQAELLLNANQFLFASHELRLYLDNYPNDTRMIALFNQYREQANRAVKEYEKKFGPLTWDALSTPNEFSWQQTAWPWEMGEM